MPDRVRTCPYCGAPLAPSPFARTATCAYCNSVVQLDEAVVPAARFHASYRRWMGQDELDGQNSFVVGGERWAPVRLIAHGEIADVHLVERLRKPAEMALLKVLRSAADRPMLDQEWTCLQALQASEARGAQAIVPRLPQPVARGELSGRGSSGEQAVVLRWAPGFEHTLEDLRAALPRGVEPVQSIWMWRRVLEILAFVHASGFVHGAVLPQHLLVEQGEHGLRLVGFGCACRAGAALAAVVTRYEVFYPPELLDLGELQPRHDLQMSARTIGHALGSDERGGLPGTVPGKLRELLGSVAAGEFRGGAFDLRERVGALGRDLFGAPGFHPVAMPT